MTGQVQTQDTLNSRKSLVQQKQEELEDCDNTTLKALIKDVKKKIRDKYGEYVGVFHTHKAPNKNTPDQSDLEKIAMKVAAENLLENRGEL